MASWLHRLRYVLLLAGIALSVTSLLGLGLGWGDSTTRSVAAPPAPPQSQQPAPSNTPTPSNPPAPSSTAAPAPGSSPAPVARENAKTFFAAFETAVRSGDVGYLTARLHPDVIKRYGTAQCRTFAARLADPSATLRLVRVTGPVTYSYASDGMTSSVPHTYVFHANGTAAGTAGPHTYHFALVAGKFRSFSDCGTPRG